MEKLSPELAGKYNIYQNDYEKMITGDEDPKGTPELLDALFTGCTLPSAKSTHSIYTRQIEDDIKEIMRQSPRTIHCNMGRLRCRENVTPLCAVCHNPEIPIHMVEYLLENGADPELPILLNGREITILDDMKNHSDSPELERMKQIADLFEEQKGLNIKGD